MAEQRPALRIGVRFALAEDIGSLLADAKAVEAAGADSLWVDPKDADPYVLLAALAAVTWRARLVAKARPDAPGHDTCALLARGRLATADELARAGERWTEVAFPKSRDEWRATRASAAASGTAGIVVPNDPRLLDLLRNPDVVDDRSDLNIATG